MGNLEERLVIAEKSIRDICSRLKYGIESQGGYYIFDYPPDKELYVREWIANLQRKNGNGGFNIVVFDLYDIIIDLLEHEDFLDQCFIFEKKKGVGVIAAAVGELLENDVNVFVEYIKSRTPQYSVIIITGVGKCYPLIRSGKVLNNLHQFFDRVPVVMFYPGKFDRQELFLFSQITEDSYYWVSPLVN